MSMTDLRQRLNDLFDYIRHGKIVEAVQEFGVVEGVSHA